MMTSLQSRSNAAQQSSKGSLFTNFEDVEVLISSSSLLHPSTLSGSILSVESNQNVESKTEKCGVQNNIMFS